MIFLKKTLWIIILGIVVVLGIGAGVKINSVSQNKLAPNQELVANDNTFNPSIQISAIEEEKTTPSTLMIYKTYYTKCKHYLSQYETIDASLVNCTQTSLKEKCRGWKIEKFSKQEVELSKEEEKFCNQHYHLLLENNKIIIYHVDEMGRETEYERTEITTEYLTQEDILKLTSGIYIYGKETLTNTLEDYE